MPHARLHDPRGLPPIYAANRCGPAAATCAINNCGSRRGSHLWRHHSDRCRRVRSRHPGTPALLESSFPSIAVEPEPEPEPEPVKAVAAEPPAASEASSGKQPSCSSRRWHPVASITSTMGSLQVGDCLVQGRCGARCRFRVLGVAACDRCGRARRGGLRDEPRRRRRGVGRGQAWSMTVACRLFRWRTPPSSPILAASSATAAWTMTVAVLRSSGLGGDGGRNGGGCGRGGRLVVDRRLPALQVATAATIAAIKAAAAATLWSSTVAYPPSAATAATIPPFSPPRRPSPPGRRPSPRPPSRRHPRDRRAIAARTPRRPRLLPSPSRPPPPPRRHHRRHQRSATALWSTTVACKREGYLPPSLPTWRACMRSSRQRRSSCGRPPPRAPRPPSLRRLRPSPRPTHPRARPSRPALPLPRPRAQRSSRRSRASSRR